MGMVRYILAIAVVIAHFNLLAGFDIPFPISSYMGVGGFFSLSGFLIYGSYLKKRNVGAYVKSRAVRLMPAYVTTILIFALGFSLISSLGVTAYFTSPQFWKYLVSNLCMLNFIQPTLPGVFDGFEIQAVNGSLWTMKVEWLLYLSVPLTAWIVAKCKGRITVIFVVIYIFSILYRIIFRELYIATEKTAYDILGRQFFGQLSYFYSGALVYCWFDVFKKYRWQLALIAVLSLLYTGKAGYYDIIVHPLAFSILVIWLSMTGKWGTWEGKKDNVSYNIYLLHFPVIQLGCWLGLQSWGCWGMFGAVLTVTVILSLLINWLVEKPIQKRFRKHSASPRR